MSSNQLVIILIGGGICLGLFLVCLAGAAYQHLLDRKALREPLVWKKEHKP